MKKAIVSPGAITALNEQIANNVVLKTLYGTTDITGTTTSSGYLTSSLSPTRWIVSAVVSGSNWCEWYVNGAGTAYTFRVYDSNGNPLASTNVTINVLFFRNENL